MERLWTSKCGQFSLITLSVFLLNYLICCGSCIVSLIGSTIVLTTVSWKITNCFRCYYLRDKIISSFQKAVLITGCDTGFGNLLAAKLNENGFMVYATVLDTEGVGAKRLTTETVFPNQIKVLRMDVTNDIEITKAYEYIRQDLQNSGNQLWAVVNNAGIATWAALDWGTMDLYRKTMDINVFGMVNVTRTFLPLLQESKGRVVNMASLLGITTLPLRAHYSMSKHAVVSFSDALRREGHKWGIKVSYLLPSTYNTPITSKDNIGNSMDTEWSKTPESVKQAYGEQQFHDLKQKTFQVFERVGSDNFHLIVNTIVRAVRSAEPRIRYLVIDDWKTCILRIFTEYLPIEWMDEIYILLAKL